VQISVDFLNESVQISAEFGGKLQFFPQLSQHLKLLFIVILIADGHDILLKEWVNSIIRRSH